MHNLSMIAAVGDNMELGYQNQLLCHLPADLKYFKKVTTGAPVIMGDKTWISLPKKPLPNRRNIVVTLDDVAFPDCETVHTLEDAMALVQDAPEAFVMGGATMYRLSCPMRKKFTSPALNLLSLPMSISPFCLKTTGRSIALSIARKMTKMNMICIFKP